MELVLAEPWFNAGFNTNHAQMQASLWLAKLQRRLQYQGGISWVNCLMLYHCPLSGLHVSFLFGLRAHTRLG